MTQITNYLSNHRIVVALIYIVVCWLLLQIIEAMYKHAHRKRSANIKDSFFKGVLEAFLVILTFIRVISLSSELENVTQTLLMSSSLIVVVLGFIFQEGLSNIVHGFILTIFKPFEIGDRVEITTGGGSEDYSYMMNRVQQHGGQAVFFRSLTTISGTSHGRYYDFDESVMPTAVKIFCCTAADIMK